MRRIRLSGRESAVVKAIGFSLPTPGTEVQERTNLSFEDLADVLNGLLGTGFIESIPYKDELKPDDVQQLEFEVNPAFAHELKAAMGSRASS